MARSSDYRCGRRTSPAPSGPLVSVLDAAAERGCVQGARILLRRALLVNAGAVVVPAGVLVVSWGPDLVEMGLRGGALGASILGPSTVVAAVDAVLARQLGRPGRARPAGVVAALLGLVQVLVAVIGLAEATGHLEAACFVVIGSTALVVAVVGVVLSLRRAAPSPVCPG